ncbi:hypothetical protein BC629DRAFT_1440220 [Irpex lacteus]|nr:hypothetical protein BC629DRAFT_1440220 [Irpex lacteus]
MDFVDSATGTENRGHGAAVCGQQETAVGVSNMENGRHTGTAGVGTTGATAYGSSGIAGTTATTTSTAPTVEPAGNVNAVGATAGGVRGGVGTGTGRAAPRFAYQQLVTAKNITHNVPLSIAPVLYDSPKNVTYARHMYSSNSNVHVHGTLRIHPEYTDIQLSTGRTSDGSLYLPWSSAGTGGEGASYRELTGSSVGEETTSGRARSRCSTGWCYVRTGKSFESRARLRLPPTATVKISEEDQEGIRLQYSGLRKNGNGNEHGRSWRRSRISHQNRSLDIDIPCLRSEHRLDLNHKTTIHSLQEAQEVECESVLMDAMVK